MKRSLIAFCARLLLLVAACVLASPTALAADTVPASELKARADRAMDRGAYSEALAAYRAAYATSPSATLLYNMGRAEEKLGNYHEALANLEAFEETATPDLKAKVPRLSATIEQLRARVARVWIRTPVRGAVILVGGEPRAATPMLRALPVAPGPNVIEVRANGYAPYRRELRLDQGKSTVIDVNLAPATASTTALTFGETAGRDVVRSEPITKKWWFWTGVGVVVAAGAGATIAILSSERSAPRGDIEPHQVAAPLLRF